MVAIKSWFLFYKNWEHLSKQERIKTFPEMGGENSSGPFQAENGTGFGFCTSLVKALINKYINLGFEGCSVKEDVAITFLWKSRDSVASSSGHIDVVPET